MNTVGWSKAALREICGLSAGFERKKQSGKRWGMFLSALVAVTEEVENRQINLQLIQLKQTN